MARYSPEQVYGFARKAGFPPDQAATMTAIALAESEGNSRAHNPKGEDSKGLWQINARAHPDLARRFDLFDPLQNARAAFEVSRRGTDISPWTVTHGGAGARYLAHQEAAQAAAVAHGDGPARGVWTGSSGYGHVVAAGTGQPNAVSADVQAAATTVDPAAGLREDSVTQRFLSSALRQSGDRYDFGTETRLDDPDPELFDCSELVQWSAHQAGVTVPDGATAQYLWAKEQGMVVSAEQAARTPGALLFFFSREPGPDGVRPSRAHVAISLGNGKTIEARGRDDPVGQFDAKGRFGFGAIIPGISDPASLAAAGVLDLDATDALAAGVTAATSTSSALAPARPPPDLGGDDTDIDGLTDRKERALGLDPLSEDTDGDELTDGSELAAGSDAAARDTDGDLLLDNFEVAQGLDPKDPDSDDDGHLDGALQATWTDTDGDHLDDPLERLLGLDPLLADTDGDGFTDGLEVRSGSDADDPLSLPVPSGTTPVDLDG